MGTLTPNVDRQVMGDVMELAIADARGDDIEQYRVNQILEQVESTIYEFPLRLPRNLALVLRVATSSKASVSPSTRTSTSSALRPTISARRGISPRAFGIRRGPGDRSIRRRSVGRPYPAELESALDRVAREDFRVQADIEDSDGLLATMTKRLILGMLLASTLSSTAFLYTQASLPATGVGIAGTVACRWRCGGRSARSRPRHAVFTRQRRRDHDGRARAGSTPPSARTPTTPTAGRTASLRDHPSRSGRCRTRLVGVDRRAHRGRRAPSD